MDIEIIKRSKEELEFEIKDRDSTILELLAKRLNEYKETEFAAQKTEHPLASYPRILLRVKKGNDAREVLLGAIDELKKEFESIKEKVKKM
ncbi:MAG: RpoL/Rpb11 RNA polymerase subunit family protein [Candidatus Anstonellales archaeon]